MKAFEIFANCISDYPFKSGKRTKETGSMAEVIFTTSIQSFNIQLGICIEKCFKDFVHRKNISTIEKIQIGNEERQADLYFVYNEKKYYFEIKNNINLDSEKRQDVIDKIKNANTDIKGVLTFRYNKRENCHIDKLPKDIIWGYNDFFSLFGEELTEDDYNKLITLIRRRYDEANI